MDWLSAISDVVRRYQEGEAVPKADPEAVSKDYQQVVNAAPPNVIAGGLAQMFRSDQTPSFAEMVADLFSRSNPSQKADLLNQLRTALSSSVVASLPGLRDLATVFNHQEITPETA